MTGAPSCVFCKDIGLRSNEPTGGSAAGEFSLNPLGGYDEKNKPLGGVERCAGPGPGLDRRPGLCAEKFKVGIVFSMTGAAAAYGATQKEGVQLAVDEINAAGQGPQDRCRFR